MVVDLVQPNEVGSSASIRISVGKDRQLVQLVATPIGPDLLVYLSGGTAPHIGAVAVGIPYPSLSGQGVSASVSLHSLVGHKDDVLAQWAADKIARSLNRTVVVTAGIHIDNAQPAEVQVLVQASKEIVDEFLNKEGPSFQSEESTHGS